MSAAIYTTASWKALYDHRADLDQMGIQPVRISLGVPKFWPEARDFPALEALMPERWMLGIKDWMKFTGAYYRKLNGTDAQASAAAITDELRAITDASGGKTLALACFEIQPVKACHRWLWGSVWWPCITGEHVFDWEPTDQLTMEAQ